MASGVTESSVMASYERRSICGLLFTDRLAKIPKGTSKESGILEITGHGLYQTSVTNFTSGADGPFWFFNVDTGTEELRIVLTSRFSNLNTGLQRVSGHFFQKKCMEDWGEFNGRMPNTRSLTGGAWLLPRMREPNACCRATLEFNRKLVASRPWTRVEGLGTAQ